MGKRTILNNSTNQYILEVSGRAAAYKPLLYVRTLQPRSLAERRPLFGILVYITDINHLNWYYKSLKKFFSVAPPRRIFLRTALVTAMTLKFKLI